MLQLHWLTVLSFSITQVNCLPLIESLLQSNDSSRAEVDELLNFNNTFGEYSDDYLEDSSEIFSHTENKLNANITEVFCYIKNPHEDVDDHLKKRMDHCNFDGMECHPNSGETQLQSSTQTHYDYYCNRKSTAKNSLTHYSCRFNYYYRKKNCDNLNECYSAHFNCWEYQIQNNLPYALLLVVVLFVVFLIFLKFICTQYFNHNRSGSYQLNTATFKNNFKCFQ